MLTIEELNSWLCNKEDFNLEFKEAKNTFSRTKSMPDYCAALSNEGGGMLILGVNNRGHVVGTNAFMGTHTKLSHDLLDKLGIRVDVEEIYHSDGRVIIFHVPAHPIGKIVRSTGKYKYPMRVGESLVEMDQITLKKILDETNKDFSSCIVEGLSLKDLDEEALFNFKQLWVRKSKRDDYFNFSNEKMVRAVNLLSDDGLNYASLVLFGKKEKIDKLIPGSEIIFEWRQNATKVAHDYRTFWREPFFKIYDKIWDTINVRNIRIPFQEGLFQRDIYAFNEKTIREALLNAVAHRDYTINSKSIFIKASTDEFFIESPGGFLPGITPDNILNQQAWRNRLISEIFEKAGLAERSGQGMDDIFEYTIREGKGLPDLSQSDDFSVRLIIPVQVRDKKFIQFLEKIINEKQLLLSVEEMYELEKIRTQKMLVNIEYKKKFLNLGIIEKVGRTKGIRYILSHKYYMYEDKIGIHTRLVGLSRDQKKELILNHLKRNKKGFFKDFKEALYDLKDSDIKNLLQELKKEGKVIHVGSRKAGYWIIKEKN